MAHQHFCHTGFNWMCLNNNGKRGRTDHQPVLCFSNGPQRPGESTQMEPTVHSTCHLISRLSWWDVVTDGWPARGLVFAVQGPFRSAQCQSECRLKTLMQAAEKELTATSTDATTTETLPAKYCLILNTSSHLWCTGKCASHCNIVMHSKKIRSATHSCCECFFLSFSGMSQYRLIYLSWVQGHDKLWAKGF